MNPLDTAIARAIELDEKGIKGPWGYYYEHKDNVADDYNGFVCTLYQSEHMHYIQPRYADTKAGPDFKDYQLAAEYRTLCPALARSLRVAIDALDFVMNAYGSPHDEDQVTTTAREALAQIRKEFE
jgi:hypothetical protein